MNVNDEFSHIFVRTQLQQYIAMPFFSDYEQCNFFRILQSPIRMPHKIIILLLAFTIASQSIFLMIKPKVPRCMVEYITGQDYQMAMKIMIDFPVLQKPIAHEHFFVTLRNSENNQTETATVKAGSRFNKEKIFEKNVIYEVCVNFKTDRKEQVMIEYEAEKQFKTVESAPKIPQGLLKKDDFKATYVAAAHIVQTIGDYTAQHKSRSSQEYQSLRAIEGVNSNITVMSVIEFVVLVAAGLYQFFTLKQYLSARQHI